MQNAAVDEIGGCYDKRIPAYFRDRKSEQTNAIYIYIARLLLIQMCNFDAIKQMMKSLSWLTSPAYELSTVYNIFREH